MSCVFVQGQINSCGLRSGETDKSIIIRFKRMTSSGLFTHTVDRMERTSTCVYTHIYIKHNVLGFQFLLFVILFCVVVLCLLLVCFLSFILCSNKLLLSYFIMNVCATFTVIKIKNILRPGSNSCTHVLHDCQSEIEVI